MLKMGFHVKWVDILTSSVRSVSYSIKINGRSTRHITPTQGLRQRDPLSPYLFLICAKGLFAMLKKFVVDGQMKGVAFCSRGLEISHLFFVDDSLFVVVVVVVVVVEPKGETILVLRKLWRHMRMH